MKKVKKFSNSFQYLDSKVDTYLPLALSISEAYKGSGVSEENKLNALKQAIDIVEGNVENAAEKAGAIISGGHEVIDSSKIFGTVVEYGGEDVYIDMTSRATTQKSIWREVKKFAKTNNEITNENIKKGNLKKVADKLVESGHLNKETVEDLFENSNVSYSITQRIAEEAFLKQKADIDALGDSFKVAPLEFLENLDNDINDINKVLKGYSDVKISTDNKSRRWKRGERSKALNLEEIEIKKNIEERFLTSSELYETLPQERLSLAESFIQDELNQVEIINKELESLNNKVTAKAITGEDISREVLAIEELKDRRKILSVTSTSKKWEMAEKIKEYNTSHNSEVLSSYKDTEEFKKELLKRVDNVPKDAKGRAEYIEDITNKANKKYNKKLEKEFKRKVGGLKKSKNREELEGKIRETIESELSEYKEKEIAKKIKKIPKTAKSYNEAVAEATESIIKEKFDILSDIVENAKPTVEEGRRLEKISLTKEINKKRSLVARANKIVSPVREEMADINYLERVVVTDGANVMPFSDVANGIFTDFKELANNVKEQNMNYFKGVTDTVFFNVGIKEGSAKTIESYLKANLGWKGDDIDQFLTTFYGKNGFMRQTLTDDNGNTVGVGMALTSTVDKKGKERHYAVLAKDTDYKKVAESIADGSFVDSGNSVKIELPSVEVVHSRGITMLKYGGIERYNTQRLSLYSQIALKDNKKYSQIVLKEQSLLSRSVSLINRSLGNDKLIEYLNEGKANVLTSAVTRSVKSAIDDGAGASSYIYLNAKDGMFKIINMNPDVVSKMESENLTELINLTPFLYEEGGSFHDKFNDIYQKVNPDARESAKVYMSKWKNELLQSSEENPGFGQKRNLDNIDEGLKELFSVELTGKGGILEQIKGSSFIEELNEDTKELLVRRIDHIANANTPQFISEHDVSKNIVSTSTVNSLVPFGDVQVGNRPLIHQQGVYENIDLSVFPVEDIEKLKESGISIGRTVESSKYVPYMYGGEGSIVYKGKYNSFLEKTFTKEQIEAIENINIINGITAKVKSVTDEEIRSLIDLKNTDEILVQNVQDVLEDGEDALEFIEKMKNNFRSQSTNEQRSVVSPYASTILRKDGIHEYKVSDIDFSLEVGSHVKIGDHIGYNAKGEKVYYEKKPAGIIKGIQDGKAIILEDSPAISEVKLNIAGTEKTVAVLNLFDTKVETDAAQMVWEHYFGNSHVLLDFELTKHKASGFALNKYTAIAKSVLATEDEDIIKEFETRSGAVLKKLYSGADNEIKLFAKNMDLSPDNNVLKTYTDVIDSYMEDIKATDGTGKNGEFLKSLGETLESYADNEYEVGIARVSLNMSYTNLGKTAYRDLHHYGKAVPYANESKALYYKFDEAGNVISRKGDVIRDFFLKEIRKDSSFNKNVENLENIKLALGLQSGDVDIESLPSSYVAKVKLNDIAVKGASASPEDMANTLMEYGGNAKVIEVDLGEDLILDNFLDKEIPLSLSERPTVGKTNKVYIAKQQNNYVFNGEEDIFMASNTQNAQRDFISNAQRASGSMTHTRNTQKSFNNLIKEMTDEFYDKDGIAMKHIIGGRMEISNQSKYGMVISPDFKEDGVTNKNEAFALNSTINTVINGVKQDATLDIVFITDKYLKRTLGDDIYENIGHQLAYENNFDSSDRFKSHILKVFEDNELDFFDNDGNLVKSLTVEAKEMIGKEYIKTEGLQGTNKRYPVFHPEAEQNVLFRLRDIVTDTESSYIYQHTAVKLNADIDGDDGQNTFLVSKGSDNRFRMFNKGTEIRDAFEDILEAQAIDNEVFWKPFAKNAYDKRHGDVGAFSVENISKLVAEEQEAYEESARRLGNFNTEEIKRKVVKAKYDKVAIGAVSTPSLFISQIASELAETDSTFSFDDYRLVVNYSRQIEQSPISAKFAVFTDDSVKLTKRYSDSISKMARGNLDEGLYDAIAVLNSMKQLKNYDTIVDTFEDFGGIDVLKRADFKSLMYEKLGKGMSKIDFEEAYKMELGLGAMYKLFSSDTAREIWESPFVKGRSGISETNSYIQSDGGLREVERLVQKQIELKKVDIENSVGREAIQSEFIYLDSNNRALDIENKTYYESIGNEKSLLFVAQNAEDKMIYKLKGDEAFTNTNREIHDFMTDDLGAVAIKRADFTKREVENLANQNVGRYIKKGEAIFNDLEERGALTKEVKNDILSSLNNELIERGKVAKKHGTINSQGFIDTMYKEASAMIKNSDIDIEKPVLDNIATAMTFSLEGENYKREEMFKKTFSVLDEFQKDGALSQDDRDIIALTLEDKFSESTVNLSEGDAEKIIKDHLSKASENLADDYTGDKGNIKNLWKHRYRDLFREDTQDIAYDSMYTGPKRAQPLELPSYSAPDYNLFEGEIEKRSKKAIGLSSDIDKTEAEKIIAIAKEKALNEQFEIEGQKISTMQSEIVEKLYGKNKEVASTAREALGYNLSSTDIAFGFSNPDDFINYLEEAGEAKIISAGQYTGAKLKELNFDEISSVLETNKKASEGSSKEIKRLLTEERNAMFRYTQAISEAETVSSDSTILNHLKELKEKSSFKRELTEEMKDSLKSSSISNAVNEINNDIVEKGRKAKRTKILSDPTPHPKGYGGLSTIATAGMAIMAVSSLMAASSGIAQSINPEDRETQDARANGITIRSKKAQNLNDVYLTEKQGNNYNISGNYNSNLNDSNIINALGVTHGRNNVRVYINNEVGKDNSKWVENQMLNYLQ